MGFSLHCGLDRSRLRHTEIPLFELKVQTEPFQFHFKFKNKIPLTHRNLLHNMYRNFTELCHFCFEYAEDSPWRFQNEKNAQVMLETWLNFTLCFPPQLSEKSSRWRAGNSRFEIEFRLNRDRTSRWV